MQVRENFNMAKSIMIQGTMSNVGKSLLAGGLCRVLKEDGIKVAPFKSQNMALNSFITADGLEMGRAQVMQAEAAMIRPEVYMNPILLKPTSDVGSQVIVNGEVAGVMPAMEYFRKKKEYIPAILEAYHKLEEKYDVIVIEGAGSPAEINLKQNDIVRALGMAGCETFIKQLPEGIETVLTENGGNLSGGQRQRISIARAIVKDAELLLFDEPTSALDYQTEINICKTIDEISKDRTVITVAHRLNTIRDYDRIYVLDRGIIFEGDFLLYSF